MIDDDGDVCLPPYMLGPDDFDADGGWRPGWRIARAYAA